MTRVLVAAVALALSVMHSHAEEAVVDFTVRPMAAAKPALKYQLLPELRELNSGNAAHNYLKCFMEQRRFFYSKETAAERALYQTMPLAELPLDKLRDYGRHALWQADWAARLDTVDWQDLQHIQEGGLDQLPAVVGPLQVLGGALQVRFRAEVAGREFDKAIRTAKTMFALSRHLGEHPSEVANLVGLWTAHLSLNTLAEMMQQPGCPNLYWALTDLPSPLVDLRKGVHGERTLVNAELRVLRDDAPMTEAEIEKFVNHFCELASFVREQAGKPPRSPRPALQARVKDLEKVSAARRRLIESGCAQAVVDGMPPLQVILLEDKREFEIQRDERMKLLALRIWQLNPTIGNSKPEGDASLFTHVLPDIVKLRRTQGQLEQQIALLRHIEAVRIYAAEHDGKLPTQLSDMTVPLPADPVTGKPFNYSVEGATAHVCGGAANEVHYKVTLQK